jgi:hypothetical protein
MFQRSHHDFTAVRPRCNLQRTRRSFMFLYHVNTGIVREHCKMSSRCHRSIVYIYTVQYWGKNGTSRQPCRYISWRRKFSFYQELNFQLVRKEVISLMRLVEKANSDNLWSRPECHVLWKAFSVYRNTAAVDMLLLKFRVMWSASLIHWSVVLWSARKPNWLAFSKFLSSMCFLIVLKINFSDSLPVVDMPYSSN